MIGGTTEVEIRWTAWGRRPSVVNARMDQEGKRPSSYVIDNFEHTNEMAYDEQPTALPTIRYWQSANQGQDFSLRPAMNL